MICKEGLKFYRDKLIGAGQGTALIEIKVNKNNALKYLKK
jgi:hypothetical protein